MRPKPGLCFYVQKTHLYGVQKHSFANRWQYKTVMKSELLMNPPEHFHDNRHNNYTAFTSQTQSTKNKEKAFVLD